MSVTDNEAFWQALKDRDTRGRIKSLKSEIKSVNVALGISANLSSVTKINEECLNFAKKLSQED